MSDVTDINALIERVVAAVVDASNIVTCGGYYEIDIEAAEKAVEPILRTLAERQPVGEKRIVVLGRIAQAYERDDEAHAFDKALDAAYHAGRQSVTDQAAEQRGADRAFEEAERYRTLAEAVLECEYPHLRELARLALRQRIGGQ